MPRHRSIELGRDRVAREIGSSGGEVHKSFTLTVLLAHRQPRDSPETVGRSPVRTRTVTASSLASRRRAALLALVVVSGLGLLALLMPASAMAKEKPCAEQIVADWYDNQRVDKLYPTHCYHDAIDSLGPDMRDYTNLEEAILRALQYSQAGTLPPANGSGSTDPGALAIDHHNTAPPGSADVAVDTVAASSNPSTSGPSSVPIPLIVLAGLAGLLLIAGGAGYIARRVQARRGGPPPAT